MQTKRTASLGMRACVQAAMAVVLCLPVYAQRHVAEAASAGGNLPVAGAAKPIPGPLPRIAKPVLFNTPEADRILERLQIFPPNNPWNEDISRRPVRPNSARIIASMDSRPTLGCNLDMGFVIVPQNQPKIPIRMTATAEESDPGPYPIPDNAPPEGWPAFFRTKHPAFTLEQVQREGEGDRHVLVLDPYAMKLYELFEGFRRAGGWEANQVSVFDLRSNKLRPDGWSSADAAGLPILPAVVRFDECERGMVNHALRVTARRTQRAFVYPATHLASKFTDPDLPRMGERLRLRPDFDEHGFSPHAKAILKGLKKYGMFVADNGLDWLISVAPDERIKGLDDIQRVKPSDFEVIVPTGPAGR